MSGTMMARHLRERGRKAEGDRGRNRGRKRGKKRVSVKESQIDTTGYREKQLWDTGLAGNLAGTLLDPGLNHAVIQRAGADTSCYKRPCLPLNARGIYQMRVPLKVSVARRKRRGIL